MSRPRTLPCGRALVIGSDAAVRDSENSGDGLVLRLAPRAWVRFAGALGRRLPAQGRRHESV
ncbi:hypothetical protein [Streptomyces sp. NPDC014676]|uniref:hypothetical protein n=1 Tax=Streptomyces sp. NPDC014676 TaxID=3364879 RepID=UPI0036FF9B31